MDERTTIMLPADFRAYLLDIKEREGLRGIGTAIRECIRYHAMQNGIFLGDEQELGRPKRDLL